MTDAVNIKDLEEAMLALLRQAYDRGSEEALDRVLAAARNGKAVSAAPPSADPERVPDLIGIRDEAPVRRAPKGALDPLLDEILRERPGLTTGEVENAVRDRDPRIAIKSVYNRLRHCERLNEKFQRQDGKWFIRVPPPPAVPPMPQNTGAFDDEF